MSKLDDILAVGVPYMNEKWAQFPDDQWHMIEGFQHTKGFQEAKQQVKALMLELIGKEHRFISDIPAIDEVIREELRAELRKKVEAL